MTLPQIRVAIVDSNPEERNAIGEYLSEEGLVVALMANGPELSDQIDRSAPDIILLDLNLRGENGLDMTRALRRAYPSLGIIIVSGKRDVIDRVAGLEVGADDYVMKPFHMRELLARIRSILRRGGVEWTLNEGTDVQEQLSHKTLSFSGWILDCDARVLASPEGNQVELTSGTFDLLTAFASHPNRVLSREQLLDFIGNGEADSFDRSIDVQVGRLRRRIEKNPRRPAIIKTVRNIGYMLDGSVRLNALEQSNPVP